MKTFTSFRNQTQINELFGLGKKKLKLTPDQHLKHLSDAAHSASAKANESTKDSWSQEPDPHFISTSDNEKRKEILKTHKKLYKNANYTVDPERVMHSHRRAAYDHADAATAHAHAAAEAMQHGKPDLTREHLEHAKKHTDAAEEHMYESHRAYAHYPW